MFVILHKSKRSAVMQKVCAYFDSMCDARKAIKALNDMGCSSVHLDLAGAFEHEFATELAADGDSTPGLSSLAMRSSDHLYNLCKTSYITPGTCISGIGSAEDCTDIAVKLFIKLDGEDPDEARRIIAEFGGKITAV